MREAVLLQGPMEDRVDTGGREGRRLTQGTREVTIGHLLLKSHSALELFP